jgi:hypothetical protein
MRPVRQSILIRALVLAFTVLLLVHFWFPSSGLAVSYRPTWGSGWKTYFDHENPSDTKDEPSDREKQPSHPQEESSHAQEEPSHAQEEPSHAQEEPSHAQEEPSHAKEEPPHPQDQSDPYCDAFVGSDRIVITVKTGATQANVKIPSQLSTTLRCAPNVLIFSDMEQKLGDRQVYDALETIADTVKDTNADFDLYRKQQELKDPDQIIVLQSELKDAAWRLDKYKFIHVLGRSWAMLPDKDWYFHLDADTYVVWSSLLEYVRRLDPSEEVFLAAVTYMGGSPFGYGGGGLLLSRAAMQKFALNYTEIAANWDPHVHEHCCGDWVVSQALKEIGVDVADVFPTFIGTRPPTIPFYDDEWCQPLVTLHHMSTEDDEEVAKFEERRRNITVREANLLSPTRDRFMR